MDSIKILVAHTQVHDAFNEADDSHEGRTKKVTQGTEDRNQEHDDPCPGVSQNELVDAEGPEQDTADASSNAIAVLRRRRVSRPWSIIEPRLSATALWADNSLRTDFRPTGDAKLLARG